MQEEDFKYFKVYYSKDVRKKKKVFSQGVLACQGRKTKLYNQDGENILTLNQKNNPEIDQQYTLNNAYCVLIDSVVSKEKFISGKVFIPQQIKPINQILKKKQPVKQQTSVVANNSKTLQNGLMIELFIYQKLRQHQIQGVQFMYDCIMGYKNTAISGCILADFMGLGKTLQTLCVIFSSLKMKKIMKAIVVCPLTLVGVWKKQCEKWIGQKLNPLICLGDGQEVRKLCINFSNNQYRLLIISYESFYKFIDILNKKCDLIVFDEGHRLKNKNSKVYRKILTFSCKKRILLTGTPLQNNLQQLFTCISVVNPYLFGSQQLFKNVFQKPIILGMAKNANSMQRKIAYQRTIQLANKIKQFSLRRKADILQQYLPQKKQYFVLFKLTPLQKQWYDRMKKIKEIQCEVLSFLNLMRKLFTHPQIFKTDRLEKYQCTDFLQDCMEENSYKINFIVDICKNALKNQEKVVIVSYFTQTLDFIQKILKQLQITCSKLDGRSDGKDRQNIITSFIKQRTVLLLSGKAGGTGLTLVCANKMIMVQPDWNPSNDAQVMGRIWRQGQQKPVSIYRLIIVSSFQQKIIERQQLKQSLSEQLIDQKSNSKTNFDFFSMKKLFIDSSQKSLMFGPNQNKLNLCKENSEKDHINWDGVVHVQIKTSHQIDKDKKFENQFENPEFDLEQTEQKQQQQQQEDELQKYEQKQVQDTITSVKNETKPLLKQKQIPVHLGSQKEQNQSQTQTASIKSNKSKHQEQNQKENHLTFEPQQPLIIQIRQNQNKQNMLKFQQSQILLQKNKKFEIINKRDFLISNVLQKIKKKTQKSQKVEQTSKQIQNQKNTQKTESLKDIKDKQTNQIQQNYQE